MGLFTSLGEFADKIKQGYNRKFRMKRAIAEAIEDGKNAARTFAPVLTGWLRSNIQSQINVVGKDVQAYLYVDLSIVPYARRQEYEHITKGFFMLKGTLVAQKRLEEITGRQDFIEDVVFNEP